VANLGPGYDVLGLAVAGIGDSVTAWPTAELGVRIRSISGDEGVLSLDSERNTAGIAARETLRRAGADVGVELAIDKGMPIGSGLGSSAASAAAAAFAVNVALGSPLSRIELVEACVEAEAAVSGRHADNVAPAVLGGLVLVRGVNPLEVVRLPVPEGLFVALVTPKFQLETRAARDAVPATVSLAERTRTAADIGTFVAACYSSDIRLLAGCVRDEVVTPARAALIPGAADAIDRALSSGALSSSISGAGPTIFALCHSSVIADRVVGAMASAFSSAGLSSTSLVSPAECPGARLDDG
jgi:homoserine kinase